MRFCMLVQTSSRHHFMATHIQTLMCVLLLEFVFGGKSCEKYNMSCSVPNKNKYITTVEL